MKEADLRFEKNNRTMNKKLPKMDKMCKRFIRKSQKIVEKWLKICLNHEKNHHQKLGKKLIKMCK